MMVGIANLFQHTDSTIRQYAIDCLSKLHSAHTIPRWGPQEAIIPTFWSISSKVIFSLARQMLDDKKSEEEIKALLNLLKKLLKSRCEFMRKHWVSQSNVYRLSLKQFRIGYRNGQMKV
jgi:neurofibromin 1